MEDHESQAEMPILVSLLVLDLDLTICSLDCKFELNHISICIVIHLCFGIDSTTFAINMVPSGPAPVPVVEGLLSFP